MKIESISIPGYEEVWAATDEDSGLIAYIAVHSTRLGPALGGIRMYPYASRNDALQDVLRLAKAMSYKAAAAHLSLGGGKAVILGDSEKQKNDKLLAAMGNFIEHLEGRFIAAKDAGITTIDLIRIYDQTRHVAGLPLSLGGSDDPSPWTAAGILEGMKACQKEETGNPSMEGSKVLIQGVGHVGFDLASLLHKEGAILFISDPNVKALDRARQIFPAEVILPHHIFSKSYDVFSPCAMGQIINDTSIRQISCRIVAGGANNQLADETRHGDELASRGILYAPDYVINAGGLINIYVKDILKQSDPKPWIDRIGTFLKEIFDTSKREFISPAKAANLYAEEILKRGSI